MRRLVAVLLLALLGTALLAPRQAAASGREDAIKLLDETRQSVDRTLGLIKAGKAEQALEEARSGYLSHFEAVETPLRIADNDLTIRAEFQFASIRTAISDHRPVDEIRDKIVELRGMLDDAERKLTEAGVGAPALITGQPFLILFREGFEGEFDVLEVIVNKQDRAHKFHYPCPPSSAAGDALPAVGWATLGSEK